MNLDSRSYIFEDQEELMSFITKEVMKYIGHWDRSEIIYKYNRMTIDELAMEVYIKILRSTKIVNKAFVRQAVIYVCIDEYRKTTEICGCKLESSNEEGESYTKKEGLLKTEGDLELVERLMTLKIFEPRELEVISAMMEGKRNPEIRKELKIPKLTYYSMLHTMKLKYIDYSEDLKQLEIILNKTY